MPRPPRAASLSNAAPKQMTSGATPTLHGEDAFEHVTLGVEAKGGRWGYREFPEMSHQFPGKFRIPYQVQEMPPRKRAVKKAYWSEEGRLASFTNWPFGDDVTCTAEKVPTPPHPQHARALSLAFWVDSSLTWTIASPPAVTDGCCRVLLHQRQE